MDIQKLVSDKVGQLVSDNTIEDLITKTVEDTIQSVVRNTFTGYEFHNAIKEKMKSEVDSILGNISLQGYNTLFLERINAVIKTVMDEDMLNKINEYFRDIFMPAKEVKLSELFEMIRKSFIYDDYEAQYDKYFTLHFGKSEYGSFFIHFDKENDKKKYMCSYELLISDEGEIYSLKLDNVKLKKGLSSL